MTAVAYVVLSAYTPFGIEFVLRAIIISACIVLCVADYKYQILPDEMIIIVGIAAVLRLLLYIPAEHYITIVFSSMVSMGFYYILWYATNGRGMGFGDVKLAGVMGLLVGYPLIIFAHYIAFLTGASVGVILILTKYKSFKSKIAFGPFMLFGLLITILNGQQLLAIWYNFF